MRTTVKLKPGWLKPVLWKPSVLVALFASLVVVSPARAQDETRTRVFLNGVPTPVYFNDGDSFRILDGPMGGTAGRLAGFNSLESYGGVHQWGDWTAHELYLNAKMATLNGRKGTWHCEGDPANKDGYGRILWWCKDLAIDQVRKGLAHAMTVDSAPADPDVLAAQAEAIRERRGLWAHGVPAFVLTSLHSASEGGGSDGTTYNRLCSTLDGHSEKWIHEDNYTECDTVCHTVRPLSAETLSRLVEAARAGMPAAFAEASDREIARRIQNVVDVGHVGWVAPELKDDAKGLTQHLKGVLTRNEWEPERTEQGSCMVYVDFKRRYGSKRASCLDK